MLHQRADLFLVVKSCWRGCVSGLDRYQAKICVRSYAQRDLSLWNPAVEAITIWLVKDSACRSFSLYLLVLRETDERDGFCSCLGRDNIARSPVAQITWTGPGKTGQSTRFLRPQSPTSSGYLGGSYPSPPFCHLQLKKYAAVKLQNAPAGAILLRKKSCSHPSKGLPVPFRITSALFGRDLAIANFFRAAIISFS